MIAKSYGKSEYCFIKRLANCLSNQPCYDAFPLGTRKSFRFPESPVLGGVSVLDSGHCNRCGVI